MILIYSIHFKMQNIFCKIINLEYEVKYLKNDYTLNHIKYFMLLIRLYTLKFIMLFMRLFIPKSIIFLYGYLI